MRLQSHCARVFGGALLVSIVTNPLAAQGDSLRVRLTQRITETAGAVVGVYYKSVRVDRGWIALHRRVHR